MRRSPAEYCYSPMPLDLHVLSLSLAFILSQDQTLHSKIKLSITHTRLYLSLSYFFRLNFFSGLALAVLYYHLFNILKNSSVSFVAHRFYNESGCKDKSFYSPLPNLFASFFKLFSGTAVSIRLGIMSGLFYKPAWPPSHWKRVQIYGLYFIFQIFCEEFLKFFIEPFFVSLW